MKPAWSNKLIELATRQKEFVLQSADKYKILDKPSYDAIVKEMDTLISAFRAANDPHLLSRQECDAYTKAYR